MYEFAGHRIGVAETNVVFLTTLFLDVSKQRAIPTLRVTHFGSNGC
jgi:hypothetical protein